MRVVVNVIVDPPCVAPVTPWAFVARSAQHLLQAFSDRVADREFELLKEIQDWIHKALEVGKSLCTLLIQLYRLTS